jgi:hypothetical protein
VERVDPLFSGGFLMPVISVTTMNQILDAWLGTTRAAGTPDSYDVELWIDDPRTDSPSEADWVGYSSVSWSSDDWLDAEGGEKDSDGLVDFGAPDGAGTDAARYWALRDPDTEELAYSAPLESPLSVTAAGDNPVKIRLTVPFAGRN